jgi:hypothetical protein
MMRFLSILPIVSIGGLIILAIATAPSLNGANLQSSALLGSTSNPSQNFASQKSAIAPDFLVLGGGGAPSYNEIAIEKNVLYFQRTMKTFRRIKLPSDIAVVFLLLLSLYRRWAVLLKLMKPTIETIVRAFLLV